MDESGNVANFNETEQVVVLGESPSGLDGYDKTSIALKSNSQVQVFSYVQTRGSVPVYWSEVINLQRVPELRVRPVDLALNSARKHFDEQIRLYGDNYLVNLVNQSGREEKVKAAYEDVVRALISSPTESKEGSEQAPERFRVIEPIGEHRKMDQLHYVYFDFHHECRNMKWDRVRLLFDKLGDGLDSQGYFHSIGGNATASSPTVMGVQKSVVRTNCMDCLDRTNVVQSMLARWTLNRQLIKAGILDEGEKTELFESFEEIFRNGRFYTRPGS